MINLKLDETHLKKNYLLSLILPYFATYINEEMEIIITENSKRAKRIFLKYFDDNQEKFSS